MNFSCDLCGSPEDDDLDFLTSAGQAETLTFLKGSPVSPDALFCQKCLAKVNLILAMKSEINEMAEVVQDDLSRVKESKVSAPPADDELDLNELDQLSLFYAEHDDLDNDPDFFPKPKPMGIKKKTTLKKTGTGPSLPCQLCDSKPNFFSKSDLEQHFVTIHNLGQEEEKTGAVSCLDCQETCESRQKLMEHILADFCKPKGGEKTFECVVCNRSFRRLSTLKCHNKRCNRDILAKSHCDICGKPVRPGRMASHLSFEHVCKQCNHGIDFPPKGDENCQIFANRKQKCKHLKEFHNMKFKKDGTTEKVAKKPAKPSWHELVGEGYACPDCGRSYKTTDSLRIHRTNLHGDASEMLKCPYCDYKVSKYRRYTLNCVHIPGVHPDKVESFKEILAKRKAWRADYATRAKVQCFLCDYATTKGTHLKRHYKNTHGYDFEVLERMGAESLKDPDPENPDGDLCPECGQHSANKAALIHHLLKEHSKVTEGDSCLYCPHIYIDVEEHMNRVHLEEKNSESQICRKCSRDKKDPKVLLFKCYEDLSSHYQNCHNRKVKRLGKAKEGTGNARRASRPNNSEVQDEDGSDVFKPKKKYVPEHLSGICPHCEFKFADLLGHIRINHQREKKDPGGQVCNLCRNEFKSQRELVTHRQLHPQFKYHQCGDCKSEFETVKELRIHRSNLCSKKKKRKRERNVTTTAIAPVKQKETHSEPREVEDNNHPLSTLIKMAKELEGAEVSKDADEVEAQRTQQESEVQPVQQVDFEGRGTAACVICGSKFFEKAKLRKHYVNHHAYVWSKIDTTGNERCKICRVRCGNLNAVIRHYFEFHSKISGEACPYCDSKWGWKKFDELDNHVEKHHRSRGESKTQNCKSCKAVFPTYEALKAHCQLHAAGAKSLIQVTKLGEKDQVYLNQAVFSKNEIENRGGVKCQLCSVFKIRKDQLKVHYERYHGYKPKLAIKKAKPIEVEPGIEVDLEASLLGPEDMEFTIHCPTCSEVFQNNHYLIKHLLQNHCEYSGLICPYCPGHHPQRYVDLQVHVTANHMDKLTGYEVENICRACKKTFRGYAELRDHVQQHGDMFREPRANVEQYKETAKKKRQALRDDKRQKKRLLMEESLKKHREEASRKEAAEEPGKEPATEELPSEIESIDCKPANHDGTVSKLMFPENQESDLKCLEKDVSDIGPEIPMLSHFEPLQQAVNDMIGEKGEDEDQGQKGIVVFVTPTVPGIEFKVPNSSISNEFNLHKIPPLSMETNSCKAVTPYHQPVIPNFTPSTVLSGQTVVQPNIEQVLKWSPLPQASIETKTSSQSIVGNSVLGTESTHQPDKNLAQVFKWPSAPANIVDNSASGPLGEKPLAFHHQQNHSERYRGNPVTSTSTERRRPAEAAAFNQGIVEQQKYLESPSQSGSLNQELSKDTVLGQMIDQSLVTAADSVRGESSKFSIAALLRAAELDQVSEYHEKIQLDESFNLRTPEAPPSNFSQYEPHPSPMCEDLWKT